MFKRIVLALVIGVLVTLGCLLVGGLVATIKVEWAATIGDFFKAWAGVLGFLAFLWFAFSGYILNRP